MTEQIQREKDSGVTSDILERNPELQGIGSYEYGWSDSDSAGANAKRGIDEAVVEDISQRRASRNGCSSCARRA